MVHSSCLLKTKTRSTRELNESPAMILKPNVAKHTKRVENATLND